MIKKDNKNALKCVFKTSNEKTDDNTYEKDINIINNLQHDPKMIKKDNKNALKCVKTSNEHFICVHCDYTTSRRNNYIRHISTRKHKICEKRARYLKTSKNEHEHSNKEKVYFCKECDFETNRLWDYKRHLQSSKHFSTMEKYSKMQLCIYNKKTNNEKHLFHCECGKQYKFQSSLTRHKKKCNYVNNVSLLTNQNAIKDIIRQNMTQITNIYKTTTNSNNTIQHNHFNLQFFLNDTCKNAMNLNEFVQNINYVQPTWNELLILSGPEMHNHFSKIILKQLTDLDITKRPIHCTDKKRNIVYIKDNNHWEKDNECIKITKAVDSMTTKQEKTNMSVLKKWREDNPDYLESNNKSEMVYHATQNILEGNKTKDKCTNKIVSNILENTKINKTNIKYIQS
jgi:hypothetical protein